MKVKTILSLSTIALCMFLLSGCGNYAELNRLALVVAIGIDKPAVEKDTYRVTLQVVKPKASAAGTTGGGGDGVPFVNYTGEGRTLIEAMKSTSVKLSRKGFYSHTTMIVVDENTARDNILKVVDFMSRNTGIPLKTSVVIARNTTAEQILQSLTPLDTITGVSFFYQIKNAQDILGSYFNATVHDLMLYTRPGDDLAVNGIELTKNKEQAKKKDNTEKAEPAIPIMKGMGLFKKGKLVHWLDEKESRSLVIAFNQFKAAHITVPCGEHAYASLAINFSKVKKQVVMKQGIPHITARIKLKGFINEASCAYDLSKPEALKKIEHEVEVTIRDEFMDSVRESQAHESGVFAFGYALHTQHPQQWEKYKNEWYELEKKAKLQVVVDVSLEHAGIREEANMN
ncbi:Ger(x)C family spore germination protein [Ectobacillus sp. JY-23]|uniref:Ger(x)C family spore germination protein n=1 Tax=Ectobacillus sp. JY-23 TaxID=2933872 RepID=UPI001FF3F8DD|nr:Ger(x)C family spore germination protein [Ectobacillus sp. JY-23]UOY94208.1 Ger(x)C family spore germination protein [Ectobacillus sp. JY-23]